MTLLYLDDQKDYLFALLSRYFDDIITLSVAEIENSFIKRELFGCLVANLNSLDALQTISTYKRRYPKVPFIVAAHENIDIPKCINYGIDGFILVPYDDEQVDRVMNKQLNHIRHEEGYIEREALNRDPITSLLNGFALYQKIKAGGDNALLLIDFDNFDIVNTLYGMQMGDKVLAKIAGFLHRMAPVNSSLYRNNGDEFVIFIEEPVSEQEKTLAKQIKAFFEQTHFVIDGINFNMRASIGIATGDPSTLLHNAKVAVREAKDNGKNNIVVYRKTSPYLKKQREILHWINEIKAALEEGRVKAYYQPIFDNKTKKIRKYEALCRVEDRDQQVMSPQKFIKAALIGGLMTNITRAMIDQAFKRFSGTKYEFSINVTREDFMEGYLLAFLKRKCFLYNIEPSQVFIEIVESISFKSNEGCIDQILKLSQNGFKLAIDDFGSENSNYSRLLNVQANYLKIDGKFIENVDQNTNSQIIIESIVDFARKIGAKTIAEYVSSPSVFDTICRLGVDYSQGYYIGKAQPYLVQNTQIK